ncbi:hypothetical protein [Phycicoccus sonneratiae]|uniref:Uncharacterized protein n=1 Tax=Phycicoccus sonneratiae TaxID=2807628 RepID=A0ABS2CQ45_9MICO|nr:hypothetical protein [Phycicoccus sonneraticus]MBM6401261.1 hypothetical protein [Phycicoccus sonneraticus]
MSNRHDDTDPIEHDPTGMRALLGSLPDPGPMPADLVARIEAALAAEAAAEASAAASSTPLAAVARLDPARGEVSSAGGGARAAAGPAGDADDEGSRVVPLRRRSRWHLVAVAAGVVGVLGLGGLVVETLRPGGLQASIGMSAEDSAAGGSSGSGAEPDAAGGGPATLFAEDGALGVVVLGSGRQYSTSGLADEVRASLPWDGTGREATATSSPQNAPQSDREQGFGPLAGAAGARACADGLGVPATETVVVDLATVDGQDAAVLVATSSDGERRVWAVSRSCSATAPGVLAGPVPVS